MNYWTVIFRYTVLLVVILAVIAVVFLFLPPSRRLREYHERRLALQAANEALEMEVRELADKQARFRSDPAFVERTAREAGMVLSNEVIYKLELPLKDSDANEFTPATP